MRHGLMSRRSGYNKVFVKIDKRAGDAFVIRRRDKHSHHDAQDRLTWQAWKRGQTISTLAYTAHGWHCLNHKEEL